MIKNLIFDLDGTLLDTIKDIQDAINDALKASGFSYSFTEKECHFLIGDGADYLLHRALKNNDNPSNFIKLKREYMPRYKAYQERHTKPFEGIPSVLENLKNHDISLFVCTNKPDEYAQIIIRKFFKEELFKGIRGLGEGELPKPNPAITNYFLSTFKLKKEETFFVGDSITDLRTAEASSLPLALCLWGYGNYLDKNLINGAAKLLKEVKDIEKLVL